MAPRQRILALVPPEQLARVQLCAPAGVAVRALQAPALLHEMRAGVGDFVVVDPEGWHVEALSDMAGRVTDAGARLVLYGRLGPMLCQQAEAVALKAVSEVVVVLGQAEESIDALKSALRRQAASVPARVASDAASSIVLLRSPLAEHTLALFGGTRIPDRNSAFASLVELSEKVIGERNRTAGLQTLGDVLDGARVARGFDLILSGEEIGHSHARAGFRSERGMRNQFMRLFGKSPLNAVRSVSTDEATAIVFRCIAAPSAS